MDDPLNDKFITTRGYFKILMHFHKSFRKETHVIEILEKYLSLNKIYIKISA
jgi:hypothetical protein